MRYGYVENGKVLKAVQRPNWRYDDGSPVSDAYLIENGYYPVVDSPPALFNKDTQRLERLPTDQWHVKADRVEVAYHVTDKTLDEVVRERTREVNRLRDEGIFSGSVPWTRPSDGTVIPVDMRSQRDRDNIQDLRSAAMVLDSQGVTQAAMPFRAGDDVIYNLTPQQMIAMSQAMMQRGQAWYAAAWAHKDAIKKLSTPQEVANYDLTQGWPEE